MNDSRRPLGLALRLGSFGLFAYTAIHSLPGTGAWRTLCLLLILAGLGLHAWRAQLYWPRLALDGSGWMLVALTLWLLLQSAFFSVDGSEPLRTLVGQWSKILLLAALGVGLAGLALREGQARLMILAVFGGYFIHVIFVLGYLAALRFLPGTLNLPVNLVQHPNYNYGLVSPLIEAALGISMADGISRLLRGERLLPFSLGWLGMASLLALVALILLKAKASLLGLLIILGLASLAVTVFVKHWRSAVLAISAATLAIVLAFSVFTTNRWEGALDSIRAGVEVDSHRAWLGKGEPLPEAAEESFYLRSAWIVVGWRGLVEHPLGRGYGFDAFGRWVAEKYGSKGGVSSHSGWLDFALANGIPGLMLMLGLGFTLCRHSWRSFGGGWGAGGLGLCFVTANYMLRSSIDGHFTPSRLMGFALVAGLLWGLARKRTAGDATGPG